MTNLIIGKDVTYDGFKFNGSLEDIPFNTSYTITNPKTNATVKFEFVESTGSEWEMGTVWKYSTRSGIQLHLQNYVTEQMKSQYLNAKLR